MQDTIRYTGLFRTVSDRPGSRTNAYTQAQLMTDVVQYCLENVGLGQDHSKELGNFAATQFSRFSEIKDHDKALNDYVTGSGPDHRISLDDDQQAHIIHMIHNAYTSRSQVVMSRASSQVGLGLYADQGYSELSPVLTEFALTQGL